MYLETWRQRRLWSWWGEGDDYSGDNVGNDDDDDDCGNYREEEEEDGANSFEEDEKKIIQLLDSDNFRLTMISLGCSCCHISPSQHLSVLSYRVVEYGRLNKSTGDTLTFSAEDEAWWSLCEVWNIAIMIKYCGTHHPVPSLHSSSVLIRNCTQTEQIPDSLSKFDYDEQHKSMKYISYASRVVRSFISIFLIFFSLNKMKTSQYCHQRERTAVSHECDLWRTEESLPLFCSNKFEFARQLVHFYN